MANEARKYTNKLLTMIDDGLLSPMAVVNMAMSYMSESDVHDMMDANELTERFTEDDDNDDDDETE
jgi:uncharacterized membrane protein YjgN (DUF898 family)